MNQYALARHRFPLYVLQVSKEFGYVRFQQEALCPTLEELTWGRFKNDGNMVIVNAPPRMGKSQIATVRYAAWYLGKFPHHSVIVVCSSGALASDFGRATRNIIESPMHTAIFPECQIASDSRAKDDFSLTRGGHYYAMGMDGQLTGRGAHLFIIDDPVKSTQDALSEANENFRREIFTSAINTRLEPGGKLLVVMTKWPSEAFSGWLLEKFGSIPITKDDLHQWRAEALQLAA